MQLSMKYFAGIFLLTESARITEQTTRSLSPASLSLFLDERSVLSERGKKKKKQASGVRVGAADGGPSRAATATAAAVSGGGDGVVSSNERAVERREDEESQWAKAASVRRVLEFRVEF